MSMQREKPECPMIYRSYLLQKQSVLINLENGKYRNPYNSISSSLWKVQCSQVEGEMLFLMLSLAVVAVQEATD